MSIPTFTTTIATSCYMLGWTSVCPGCLLWQARASSRIFHASTRNELELSFPNIVSTLHCTLSNKSPCLLSWCTNDAWSCSWPGAVDLTQVLSLTRSIAIPWRQFKIKARLILQSTFQVITTHLNNPNTNVALWPKLRYPSSCAVLFATSLLSTRSSYHAVTSPSVIAVSDRPSKLFSSRKRRNVVKISWMQSRRPQIHLWHPSLLSLQILHQQKRLHQHWILRHRQTAMDTVLFQAQRSDLQPSNFTMFVIILRLSLTHH